MVVHLGTNGGITRAWVDRIMAIVGPGHLVVWVTLQLPNDYSRYTFENRSNTTIRAAVRIRSSNLSGRLSRAEGKRKP